MISIILLLFWSCFSAIPNGKVDILLIGDSLSHMWSWSDQFYVSKEYNVKRRTKIGSTTEWGLTQLRNEYKMEYPPHILIIYLGANDVFGGGDIQTPMGNIKEMITLSQHNCGYTIIVSGVRTKSKTYSTYQTHLEKMRMYSVWVIPTIEGNGYLRSDGVHLTTTANREIWNSVNGTISWVLKMNPMLNY